MANCDPWALAENLPCLTCFNPVMEEGVALALLEEWSETPTKPFLTDDQGQFITDDSGNMIVVNL